MAHAVSGEHLRWHHWQSVQAVIDLLHLLQYSTVTSLTLDFAAIAIESSD